MDKKELIYESARQIIVKNGFHDASITKIAKLAQIPVGSVYTYFKSKEQLINEIYISFKVAMGQYIFDQVPAGMDEKEELKLYWTRAVEFGLEHQEKFFFAEQYVHSGMILPATKEEIEIQFALVFDLLQKGIRKGKLKKLDLFVMHNLIYTNIVGTIKYFAAHSIAIDKVVKDQLFECCWDSLKL